MDKKDCSTADAFNRDIKKNQGYLYTTNARLSSVLANLRLTLGALDATEFKEKNVLDIGCGDGTYTFELYDRGKPFKITGVDLAADAITKARETTGHRNIEFFTQNVEELPYKTNSFDIAHLRGVLHHLKNPLSALEEALRVAQEVIVIEPNGYNPVLKVLERISRYHVEHNEKSFTAGQWDRWIRELNGQIVSERYLGFVPFFCPDILARILKTFEPFMESVPFLRCVGCGVYLFKAGKNE